LAPPFVFVFLTPSFCLLFVWPAIFNNKSKSKKKPLFGLLPGLLSLLAPNKKPQRRRKTLIIATDYKIPKSDSQILLLLRFGEKEKIEFLIGMEQGQGSGEGSKESC